MLNWLRVLRPSPIGAIVGAGLLAVSALTVRLAPTSEHVPAPAPGLRAVIDQLHHSQARADRFAKALADANRRLAAAGESTVTTTVPASAARSPSPGSETPASTQTPGRQPEGSQAPGGGGGSVGPPATAPASTTVPPATTPPPAPNGDCPPGYHPVIKVLLPPLKARVCLPDRPHGH